MKAGTLDSFLHAQQVSWLWQWNTRLRLLSNLFTNYCKYSESAWEKKKTTITPKWTEAKRNYRDQIKQQVHGTVSQAIQDLGIENTLYSGKDCRTLTPLARVAHLSEWVGQFSKSRDTMAPPHFKYPKKLYIKHKPCIYTN